MAANSQSGPDGVRECCRQSSRCLAGSELGATSPSTFADLYRACPHHAFFLSVCKARRFFIFVP